MGDTPSGIGGRIVELVGDGKGNLTGAAKTYFAGAPLINPFALTVDSAGTLSSATFRRMVMESSIRWLLGAPR